MNDWCVSASSIQYQNVCFTHVKLYSKLQQNMKTFSLGEKFAINYIKATSILVCVKETIDAVDPNGKHFLVKQE